jgi:hypothetical protein
MRRAIDRALLIAIFAAVAVCSCDAQSHRNTPETHTVAWAPPESVWPDKLPPPSVPHEQIRELRLGEMRIRLETTTLQEVQRRLGGSIGHEGDASEALDWLCVGGSDAEGRWILWLTSSEMGGGRYIDGFRWQRLAAGETPDRRCAAVPPGSGVALPVALRLGMTEASARRVLGRPTLEWNGALYYSHEHEEVTHSERYTVDSTVQIGLKKGTVSEIDVDRTTSD